MEDVSLSEQDGTGKPLASSLVKVPCRITGGRLELADAGGRPPVEGMLREDCFDEALDKRETLLPLLEYPDPILLGDIFGEGGDTLGWVLFTCRRAEALVPRISHVIQPICLCLKFCPRGLEYKKCFAAM